MLGLPAQDGFAGGGDLVEAADARGVRRGLDEFGIGGGFLGNRSHGVNEKVALFLGLGLGGSIMSAPGTMSGNAVV
jgi:hypothetical protein